MTKKRIEPTLGEAAKRFRRRADLTQAELADKTGLTQATISQIEAGKKLPGVKTLIRIAKATGGVFRIGPKTRL